jgi:hypothetical protein
MALRTFHASDGTCWTVWLVQAGSAGVIPGMPTEWLAFQNEDGSERCRLVEYPLSWERFSDEQLDELRRSCTPLPRLTGRHSPPQGTEQIDPVDIGDKSAE